MFDRQPQALPHPLPARASSQDTAALLGLLCFGFFGLAACRSTPTITADLAIEADQGVDGPQDLGPPPQLALRVDGLFDDWEDMAPQVVDPAGDAQGAFDITRLYAATRGTELFLRLDVGRVLNLAAGGPGEGDLHIILTLPDQRRLRIELRGQRAVLSGNGSSVVADWLDLRYRAAPTFAAKEFEFGLDLGTLGLKSGDRVRIETAQSDTITPLTVQLMHEALPVERRSAARAPGTLLRIASQNTLFDGLRDSGRRPRFARLYRAVAADIYCLQEAFTATDAELAADFAEVDPLGDGQPWQLYRTPNGDSLVFSRWPMTPLPAADSGHSIVAVELPGGAGHVVVVSMRPKCCGYIGSNEDVWRITQVRAIAEEIVRLRAGTLGSAYLPFKDSPVVVVGDWNLVGSRDPLTLLEDPSGPALTQLVLPQLIGNEVWTWRSPGSGYAPGRLDLLVYSADRLKAEAGFALHSGTLDEAERASLKIEADDSNASDHLLLVADFALPAP